MAKACDGRILVEVSVASGALGVSALKDAHIVGKALIGEGEHCTDSGGEVRSVGLKLTGAECIAHILAVCDKVVDGIGLITVGNDELILYCLDSGIDDKRGVLYLGVVVGLGENVALPLGEYAVTGVFASTHYEVCDNGTLAVLALTYYNTSAGIGVGCEELGELGYIVNACHLIYSFHLLLSQRLIRRREGVSSTLPLP